VIEDEKTGNRSFMKHENREVWTKLHSETLKQMTKAVPDGIYFEVATGPFDLKRIYQQVMENSKRETTDKQTMSRYQEKFHLFLAGAVVALLLSNRWRQE
jgi:hypothetical protein